MDSNILYIIIAGVAGYFLNTFLAPKKPDVTPVNPILPLQPDQILKLMLAEFQKWLDGTLSGIFKNSIENHINQVKENK